jgi:drug/metabolite transporter (DMT)-like permease
MIYILLSILSSTCIFIFFKGIEQKKEFTFHYIIVNYLTASLLGYFLSGSWNRIPSVYTQIWFLLSVVIGILFIIMFFLIGMSTQKAGLSVTTVASKMSVVLPILFSIIYFTNDKLNIQKLAGIIIALAALFLTVWKKPEKNNAATFSLLPVILFVGLGMGDSLVKYAQQQLVIPEDTAFFTAFLFSVSFLTGLLTGSFKKNFFKRFKNPSVFMLGVFLGLVNFGSVFFLIKALNHSGLDSSVVFGINNIGIVVLSVLMALLFFKEKLNIFNRIGISLSLVAIWILTGMYGI